MRRWFAVLLLAGAAACGPAELDAPGAVSVDDPKDACAIVTEATQTAAEALAAVAAVLAGSSVSADDIAKATDDLKAAFTTMHLGVAAAADSAGDPGLKAAITEYQYWVEQAIVAVEGADARPDKLIDAIELPALQDAKKAVQDACPAGAGAR